MRATLLRCGLTLAALAASLILLAPPNFAEDKKDDDGFTPLFNGKDLKGWKVFLDPTIKFVRDPMTFTVKDDVIVVSGQPNGFIYTDKGYKNYVLRYDWRYKKPVDLKDDKDFKGNSGCLVHTHAPEKPAVGKVWPQCVEVQGMNARHGQLLFLKAKGEGKYDQEARDKAAKAVGEWNTTEVVCKADGSITVKINGTEVSSGKSELTDGMIGFQSEGVELHFKNIKIKEMK